LENVGPKVIDITVRHGVQWVLAGTGGVSTFEAPTTAGKQWWILPAGHDHGTLFFVRKDEPGHWVWEPADDMPLDQFVGELAVSNRSFTKI
jgi:hypothetical protein